MMSLPPELDQCLHKHTQYILKHMLPEGVYIFLSGARLMDDEDHGRYYRTPDAYGKNHALLNIVAKHGRKGFESFLEALETTRQLEIVQRMRATLSEKSSNVPKLESIGKIKNDVAITSSKDFLSSTPSSTTAYMAGPRPGVSSLSPSYSRSRSVTRTPLTPPLSEAELDEHLRRMKVLLYKIGTTHSDRLCRQEANDLLGELEEAGDSMMDRIRQLSEENAEKERELRRAKYMVRGMETEISRLKTTSTSSANSPETTGKTGNLKAGNQNKSKTCVIL